MKHIILPTDFSENALNASMYALKLFEKERCTFHLVNCYAPLESHQSIYATSLNWDASDNVNRTNSEQGLVQFISKLKGDDHKPWHFFRAKSSQRLLNEEIKQIIEDPQRLILGV